MSERMFIDNIADFFIKSLDGVDCYKKLHIYVIARAIVDLASDDINLINDAYSYLFKSDLTSAEIAGINKQWLMKLAINFYVYHQNKKLSKAV